MYYTEFAADAPVRGNRPESDREPEGGMGLCLSGGGYRAMVFHLGALWRLNEARLLPRFDRISSVSGGSITACALGLAWSELRFDPTGFAQHFETVVQTVRKVARHTIDIPAILAGVLLPGSPADYLVRQYRDLFAGAQTLADLPDSPQFIFNATNVQTLALVRFAKSKWADYRLGRVPNPTLPLATVLAASSAFPPVLSPLVLDVDPGDFDEEDRGDLFVAPYNTRLVLTDGGVYDNLGLETIWYRCKTVFISDAGGQLKPDGDPERDWIRHSIQVGMMSDHQVRSLRKRLAIEAYIRERQGEQHGRAGAYWSVKSDPDHYGLEDRMAIHRDHAQALGNEPTRLAALTDERFEALVNWGYAITDTALRRWVDPGLPKGTYPYPQGL